MSTVHAQHFNSKKRNKLKNPQFKQSTSKKKSVVVVFFHWPWGFVPVERTNRVKDRELRPGTFACGWPWPDLWPNLDTSSRATPRIWGVVVRAERDRDVFCQSTHTHTSQLSALNLGQSTLSRKAFWVYLVQIRTMPNQNFTKQNKNPPTFSPTFSVTFLQPWTKVIKTGTWWG